MSSSSPATAEPSAVFGHFEIIIDSELPHQPKVFHGGELITGHLKILLKRPMTIQAIKLQFKGRAAYTTNDASKGGAEVEKVYFDRDFTLLERPPGRPEPGHFPWIANFLYSLPFECPLPIGCPTSFEGPYAFIRYYARATVVEENGTETVEYMVKKPLSLVAPVETAGTAAVDGGFHPVGASETASFGGCCCRGKITAEVQLPKSVYSPGESVVGALKIDNKHPRHVVDHVEVRLVDRVTRVGTSGTSSPHRTVLHRKLDQTDVVKSKTSLHRDDVLFLQIPSVAPSTPGPAAPLIKDMSPNETAPFSVDVKVPESPSTATLRFRKQPFLRLDYAIQVSLGTQLLLEVPITVAALPIRGASIAYEPFICGPQPIDETDETSKKKLGSGFLFAPQYPILRPGAGVQAAIVPTTAATPAATTNATTTTTTTVVTEITEIIQPAPQLQQAINNATVQVNGNAAVVVTENGVPASA